MTPRISVIVPLFNKSAYLREMLAAFLPQLGDGDEFLVVDDRSTDDGPELARRMLESVKGATLTVMPQNAGPASARNAGARLATGSHLLFFDADDLPSPDLLASLRTAITRHPDDVVYAYTIAFQAHGETMRHRETGDHLHTTQRPLHAFVEDRLSGRTLCTASSTCVARLPFLNAGGFQEGLRYCEDPELWARLSAIYPVIEIREVLALYRDVPHSLSYSLRGRIGAANPYVDSLIRLGQVHGAPYFRLARSLLFKNLAFARASGASSAEGAAQLASYRQALGHAPHAALRVLNRLPAWLFRKLHERRTIRQQLTASSR
jgi:glycosyltransferase involved in cell wall biosynthesis